MSKTVKKPTAKTRTTTKKAVTTEAPKTRRKPAKAKSTVENDAAKEAALKAAQYALDKKAENVRLLDLREVTTMTDFFVIATGTSTATGRSFDLVVVFDPRAESDANVPGRGIAESSFHHLVDYNWDTRSGCPTFLTELPGTGYIDHPEVLDDVKQYAANAAAWLAPLG